MSDVFRFCITQFTTKNLSAHISEDGRNYASFYLHCFNSNREEKINLWASLPRVLSDWESGNGPPFFFYPEMGKSFFFSFGAVQKIHCLAGKAMDSHQSNGIHSMSSPHEDCRKLIALAVNWAGREVLPEVFS